MVRAQLLIIDENATHQRLAALMAQRFGYGAAIVAQIEEAIEKLSSDSNIHIVLVDLEIPRSAKAVRCLDALTKLRRMRHRNFAIIANSAHAMPQDVEKSLRLGADDCLLKPYTSNQFREMLRKWTPIDERVRLAS